MMNLPHGKIVVESKDGQLLLGNHFHVLEDKSTLTFNTEDLQSFISYLKSMKFEGSIYYDNSLIVAHVDEEDRYAEPVAVCKLSNHPALDLLNNMIGKAWGINDFEELLYRMKPYLLSSSIQLLGNIKSMIVSKVTKVEREKKQNGDFIFAISSKSEKGSFEPPENLAFELPVFKHIETQCKFEIPLFFNFSSSEDGPSLYFTLKPITFSQELFDNQKVIIDEELASIKCDKFWGKLNLNVADDSWKYKANPSTTNVR